MKVILIKDVKNQGKKDDIIDVSTGYAQNYLIKNKLAVLYTEGSKKILDHELKERKEAEDALVEEYNLIKDKLKDKKLEFKVKTGVGDKVFGSISSKQIIEEINKFGYKINKKSIMITNPIDTLGNHIVTIKLHKKVEFNINVTLIK